MPMEIQQPAMVRGPSENYYMTSIVSCLVSITRVRD